MNSKVEAAPQKDTYDRWQAEDDMRTLLSAKQIQKDDKRMKNVRRAAKDKIAEMAQLKSLAAGE